MDGKLKRLHQPRGPRKFVGIDLFASPIDEQFDQQIQSKTCCYIKGIYTCYIGCIYIWHNISEIQKFIFQYGGTLRVCIDDINKH